MEYCDVMNVTLCVSIPVASYYSYLLANFTHIHYIFSFNGSFWYRNVMHSCASELSQAPVVCVSAVCVSAVAWMESKPLVTIRAQTLCGI